MAKQRGWIVRADHRGFGWEYGQAVRFEGPEGKQRALVKFGDGSSSWCERWETVRPPPHPVELVTEALDLVSMVPDDAGSELAGGGCGLLKREAMEALRRLRLWFD